MRESRGGFFFGQSLSIYVDLFSFVYRSLLCLSFNACGVVVDFFLIVSFLFSRSPFIRVGPFEFVYCSLLWLLFDA